MSSVKPKKIKIDPKKQRVIFINPEVGGEEDVPNIGLAIAATHYNVPVIDLNTKHEPKDRYLDRKADVVGIYVQSRNWRETQEIKKRYLKKYPKAIVASVETPIDIQCSYPRLSLDKEIPLRMKFEDWDFLPNFELFDSFPIFQKNWQSGKWAYTLLTSLGCPYACIYCAARLRPWIPRPIGSCMKELGDAKQKWGVKRFQTGEECFNFDKERLIKFCQEVKKLGYSSWICSNGLRADRFDEEMAKALADAGCRSIAFGIESIHNDVLKKVKKGETIEQIEEAIDISKKYFTYVTGFFIIGLPGSSYEKDLENLKWMAKKRIFPILSFHVPFEKGMRLDERFWERGAKPISDTYPKRLQQKIYDLGMSEGQLERYWLRLKLVLMFDRRHIFHHLWDWTRFFVQAIKDENFYPFG